MADTKTTTVRVRPARGDSVKAHGNGLVQSDAVEVMVYGEVRALVRVNPKVEVVWREDRFPEQQILDAVKPSLKLMATHFAG